MFWRRRKLPEDEPLVPHGLIWQATETDGSPELPPDMWDNSPKEVQGSPAEPMQMPVRKSVPQRAAAYSSLANSDPETLSPPPLKWPRVDDEEIARRAQGIDTAVSFPYRKPLVGAAVPKDLDSPAPETSEPAHLELVAVSPLTPTSSERTAKLRRLMSVLRSKLPNWSMVWWSVRTAKIFSELRARASNGLRGTTHGINLVRQRSGPALDAARLTVVESSKAAISQSRAEIRRVRENIRALDLSGPARIWSRARSLEIKIRIPASTRRLFSSGAERPQGLWLSVSQVFRGDSRAWISLGMAALSAILALIVISGLRHYGPDRAEAQPVSSSIGSPATAPVPAAGRATSPPASQTNQPKPSPTASGGDMGTFASAKPSPAAVQKRLEASPTPKRPRAHHISDEDDYVAKDTYVFYGRTGKAGR